jgi:hypothetical protein
MVQRVHESRRSQVQQYHFISSSVSQHFKEKSAVESKLLQAKHVTITLDMWRDRRMRSYLGITVHFMMSDMQFKSYLLDFNYFVENILAKNR